MDYPIDYNGLTDPTVTDYVKSSKPSVARTLFDVVVLCWGVIFGAIGLFLYAPSIWTYLLAFLVVSSRMNGCLTLAHDGWHTSLVSNRKWNDFIAGWLCSYPFGSVYGSARAGHLAHHKYLGTEADPDRPMHIEADKHTLADFVGHFARHMFIGQLIISFSKYLLPKRSDHANPAACAAVKAELNEDSKAAKRVPEFAYVVVCQALIGSSLWYLSGHWWTYFAVWFFPIVTLGTMCYFFRAFGDHGRLTTDPTGPLEGRLVSIPHQLAWERAFVSPYEFNFHAEHHLYASVPHQHLPKLHQLLRQKDAYKRQVIVRNNYSAFLVSYVREISATPKPAAIAETGGNSLSDGS